MKSEPDLKMTDLDYLTASPHLQMIKAALPYIHVPEQRFFSLMVKISELERTVRLFQETEDGMVGICSLEEDEPSSPIDMLNAMKPYGTPQNLSIWWPIFFRAPGFTSLTASPRLKPSALSPQSTAAVLQNPPPTPPAPQPEAAQKRREGGIPATFLSNS